MNNYSGFAFAAFGTLLFSLKSIFIKLLYAEGLDPSSVLTLRMAITAPMYLSILVWYTRSSPVSFNLKLIAKITLFGFFGYYLASLLNLMSLEHISAQLERLGLFTYPLLVALLGLVLFKIPITKNIILSLGLTYIGLAIVVLQEFNASGSNVLLGTVLVIGSAFSFALYVLFSKPIINAIGSVIFTSIAMLASSVFVFIHAAFFVDFSQLFITNTAWVLLLLLAVFSTVIPSFLIAESIRRIGPTQTGIMGTLGPIFTLGLASVFLNESISLVAFFGILSVLFGVLNLILSKKKA